jgi:hypothetical protein
MLEVETRNLGEKEQAALESSLHHTTNSRGMRNLVLSTFVILAALTSLSVFGVERLPLAGIALLIVAVLVAEKVSYFREIRVYRSLVRALALRLERANPVARDDG